MHFDLRHHFIYNFNNGTDGGGDDSDDVPWYYGGVFTDLVFVGAIVAFVALCLVIVVSEQFRIKEMSLIILSITCCRFCGISRRSCAGE